MDALAGVSDQITYLSTRHEQAASYMADGYARATGDVGVCMVVPGPGMLNALAGLATSLGIRSADVLALGDGRNDIEMLTWAGRGVALGDAVPEVQAAADHVTACFDRGGTAIELDRWFGSVACAA